MKKYLDSLKKMLSKLDEEGKKSPEYAGLLNVWTYYDMVVNGTKYEQGKEPKLKVDWEKVIDVNTNLESLECLNNSAWSERNIADQDDSAKDAVRT